MITERADSKIMKTYKQSQKGNFMSYKLLTIIVSSIILTACGGSDSNSNGGTTEATAFKGKAIDGYVTGATVFLDANYNGKLDSNEPNTVTGEDGDWELVMTRAGKNYSECALYAPVVVHVPVGAVDSDYGVVEEAYDMTYPPEFAVLTIDEMKHTTPLTTVVWTEVEKELAQMPETMSCENIKANYDLRNRIVERLEDQEFRVAQRYAVTVDDLYSDYVATGNARLHTMAAELVPAMQKTYAATLEIENKYPNANFTWVEYFNSKYVEGFDYEDGWYYETVVLTDNSSLQFTTKTDETMTQDLGVYIYNNTTNETVNGVKYEKVNYWFKSTGLNNTCVLDEFIEQTTQEAHGVKNHFRYDNAADFDACVNNDWDTTYDFLGQSAVVRQTIGNDEDNGTFDFHQLDAVPFPTLVNVPAGYLNAEDLDVVDYISQDFFDTTAYGASFWQRHRTEFVDSDTILTRHYSRTSESNTIYRDTLYTTGLTGKSCSYDNGGSYVPCN